MRTAGDHIPDSRSGLHRLISTWEYRHLHAMMAMRFASSGFQLGIGLVLVSIASKAETDAERRKFYRLAAWFLLPAAANLFGGLLDLSAARTGPPTATARETPA
jgi:low temperature requirement protein LtrA